MAWIQGRERISRCCRKFNNNFAIWFFYLDCSVGIILYEMVEGHFNKDMKVLMIDDVATTGGSVINAIKSLKEEGIKISDAFVIINRMEGALENLQAEGVKMYQISDIMEITKILFEEKLIDKEILEKVKIQTSS